MTRIEKCKFPGRILFVQSRICRREGVAVFLQVEPNQHFPQRGLGLRISLREKVYRKIDEISTKRARGWSPSRLRPPTAWTEARALTSTPCGAAYRVHAALAWIGFDLVCTA